MKSNSINNNELLQPGKSFLKNKKEKIGNKNLQNKDYDSVGSASAFDAAEHASFRNDDEDNTDAAFRKNK